jgi:hypothetical protein
MQENKGIYYPLKAETCLIFKQSVSTTPPQSRNIVLN